MADHITKFRDALGAADSYLHAMKQIFETVFKGGDENMDDYCALHLLADAIQREIREAQSLVDDMEDAR